MANDPNRDDLERDQPDQAENVRGMEDEDFEEAEDDGDLEDEDELEENIRNTGEVGSEGGSPGNTVRSRRPNAEIEGDEAPIARGSEAGETSERER
jgi:hypothetical protein